MTVLAATLGNGAFVDPAVGTEAMRLDRDVLETAIDDSSVERSEMFSDLAAAREKADRHNWDFEGALPLNRRALLEAFLFLQALPPWVPRPEVFPQPDGEVGFDWQFGARRLLTVSTSSDGHLHYAGSVGTATIHGKEPFVDSVPDVILRQLGRLLQYS